MATQWRKPGSCLESRGPLNPLLVLPCLMTMVSRQAQETWPHQDKADPSGKTWATLLGKKSASAMVLPKSEENQSWVLEDREG